MKRKVIQIADSTQLISLPRKWALAHGVKKGDELEITEENSTLRITTEKGPEFMKIEVDITGLDRTSILYCIESIYRLGYDEIKVIFNKPKARYLRTDTEVRVISVVHYVISRLPGFEIIQERENFCLIKDIQNVSSKEFDSMLRRIFLLLLDAFEDLIKGIETKNSSTIEMVKEKHDSITKFVSYCLRSLNKTGYDDPKKDFILYHILSSLDKVADILKIVSRNLLRYKIVLGKESIAIMENMLKSFELYQEVYYKFEISKVYKIGEIKEKAINEIFKLSSKLNRNELLFLNDLKSSLEILTDLTEARWALLY